MTYHAVCHECDWEILEEHGHDARRRARIHRVGQKHDNVRYRRID
jgi:hypothetical protein